MGEWVSGIKQTNRVMYGILLYCAVVVVLVLMNESTRLLVLLLSSIHIDIAGHRLRLYDLIEIC